MKHFKELEVWFVTGSQHLYGEETLKEVAAHAQEIANALNNEEEIPVQVIFKPTVKSPEEIFAICQQANQEKNCIGLITWMHTFSPAKMWINGLKILQKPILHLHTQYNRDIPWSKIDMDFMNTNQSAHGDREVGAVQNAHPRPDAPLRRVTRLPADEEAVLVLQQGREPLRPGSEQVDALGRQGPPADRHRLRLLLRRQARPDLRPRRLVPRAVREGRGEGLRLRREDRFVVEPAGQG